MRAYAEHYFVSAVPNHAYPRRCCGGVTATRFCMYYWNYAYRQKTIAPRGGSSHRAGLVFILKRILRYRQVCRVCYHAIFYSLIVDPFREFVKAFFAFFLLML